MDCEETYAGTPCLGCVALLLKVSELQIQVEALKQQAEVEVRDANTRMETLVTIRALADLATK